MGEKILTSKEIAQFAVHAARHSQVATDTIQELIDDLVNQEWISVEDRLPEENQVVDIWARLNHQHQHIAEMLKDTKNHSNSRINGWRECGYTYEAKKDEEGGYGLFSKERDQVGQYDHKVIENGEVTHWMPLPKPPKK